MPSGSFHDELDRIHEVQGEASGQVVLGERFSSVGVRFTASKVRLAGKYDRIPFPVTIDNGVVSYDGASVGVTNLAGSVGKSSFSGVTGRQDLSNAMVLSISSGSAHLELEEVFPWFTSLGIRGMGRKIRFLRGIADVASLSLTGPVGGEGKWTFDASGSLSDLELVIPELPGPLSVGRARFRVLPALAIFSDVEASLLDAKVRGLVEFGSTERVASQAAGSLEGEIGEAAIGWASSLLHVPPEYAIRAPLSVSAASFSLDKDESISFKGEFHRPGGAALSVSLRKTPEDLAIDSLVLRDSESDASLALHIGPKDVRLKYKGVLHRSTVEKFAAIPADPFRRLKGDLNLSVDLESLDRSEGNGTLEGEGIRIPWKALDPLRIRSVSFSAEGKKIRVVSSDLAWREIPFRLRGEGSFSREGLEADLDVETGDVQLERLFPPPPGATKTVADSGGPPVADAGYHLPKLPVRGFFRLRSNSIRYGSWTVNSVTARGELGPASLHVEVSEGNLCGFPLQLSATLDPKGAGGGAPDYGIGGESEGAADVPARQGCSRDRFVPVRDTAYGAGQRSGVPPPLRRRFRGAHRAGRADLPVAPPFENPRRAERHERGSRDDSGFPGKGASLQDREVRGYVQEKGASSDTRDVVRPDDRNRRERADRFRDFEGGHQDGSSPLSGPWTGSSAMSRWSDTS